MITSKTTSKTTRKITVPNLIFYTRAGCSLCDQAKVVLDQQGVSYTAVSIAEDATLEAKYGWDIPVLFDANTQKVVIKGVFGAARVRLILAGVLARVSGDVVDE